jgi:hypothetical protein
VRHRQVSTRHSRFSYPDKGFHNTRATGSLGNSFCGATAVYLVNQLNGNGYPYQLTMHSSAATSAATLNTKRTGSALPPIP